RGIPTAWTATGIVLTSSPAEPLATWLLAFGGIAPAARTNARNSADQGPYPGCMSTSARRWLAGAIALLLGAAPGLGCTTFVLRDGGMVLFGKNYDWSLGDGLLVVNPRGLERSALV